MFILYDIIYDILNITEVALKILVVREHFKDGKPLNDGTMVLVYVIQPSEDIGFGLSRIANVDGHSVFQMKQAFEGSIVVTDSKPVPHVLLNGVAITDVCERSFEYGDVLKVHYTYGSGDFLVTCDTVVLVPDDVPAQMSV